MSAEIQENLSAEYICPNESRRIIQRAIDVSLGGKIYYEIIAAFKQLGDLGYFADVAFDEFDIAVGEEWFEIF